MRCLRPAVQAHSSKLMRLPMYRRMSLLWEHRNELGGGDEFEITAAAVCGYGRLLHALGGRVITHGAKDGGLICEHRAATPRPTLWRISADGTVVPDSPYNFLLGAFVPASLP